MLDSIPKILEVSPEIEQNLIKSNAPEAKILLSSLRRVRKVSVCKENEKNWGHSDWDESGNWGAAP